MSAKHTQRMKDEDFAAWQGHCDPTWDPVALLVAEAERARASEAELLKALRNARAVLASTETVPSWDYDRRTVLDLIHAALAKARGTP